jgi:hydroxymethylpyrimidine/phosphomethylpyrimidine kinase
LLNNPGLVISADVPKDSTAVRAPIKKSRFQSRPCALSIAGSDSGGGAGIQADIKTFTALGVHATTAITCITAQNPQGVRSVQPIRPAIVRDQIDVILESLRPECVKTGMLYSAEIIGVVSATVPPAVPLIVDPVMISTSGSVLLKPGAVAALKLLIQRAQVVTPNLHEAEFLLKRSVHDVASLRAAAREIHESWGCAALVKGGHLPRMRSAVDFFYDGSTELMLEAEFIRGITTHGTGCTYSAAIAGYVALGHTIQQAVVAAKKFITRAIADSYKTAGQFALNPS